MHPHTHVSIFRSLRPFLYSVQYSVVVGTAHSAGSEYCGIWAEKRVFPQMALPLPQDRVVERVRSTNEKDDSGRYAVAKTDLSPGELVLLASPYAVALNPNEAVSAMSLSANVEEWEVICPSKREKGKTIRKKGKHTASLSCSDHIPLIPSPTYCCSCFRRIPSGTPFLNCETIKQLSSVIAAEHTEHEKKMSLCEQEAAGQCESDEPLTGNVGTSVAVDVDGAFELNAEQLKKLQKPTKSSKMKPKGCVALKINLYKSARARREMAMQENCHYEALMNTSTKESSSWPERVVEDDGVVEGSVVDRGLCGCSGCGVLVYCSKACWSVFHTLHRESGDCRILRNVYPALMKTFMTRGGGGSSGINVNNGANKKGPRGGQFFQDLWNPRHWLRRINEDGAWEMQLLLLSALVIGRAVKEGFASHVADDSDYLSTRKEDVEGVWSDVQKRDAPAKDGTSTTVEAYNRHGVALVKDQSGNVVETTHYITAESMIPREVGVIQRARLHLGCGVEVLDPRAAEQERHDPKGTFGTMEMSGVSVVADNQTIHGVPCDGAGTYRVRLPKWPDTAALITNISALNKDTRGTFRKYYRQFTRVVLPWLGMENKAETTPVVSASFFDRLSAAVQCNSFGLFNTKDICIGVALFPEASYFNHSCVPNLCRVMCEGRIAAFYALREIKKGEPLTICYVDVQESSTSERRRTLLLSYRFFCQCERCRGKDGSSTADMEFLRFCEACETQGYLRPLPPAGNTTGTWDADAVQTGECSVCRCRVPWHKNNKQQSN
ncbi:SET domain [Trypanosoma vivax]|nr:SET domain [Trypanosoma vivax]